MVHSCTRTLLGIKFIRRNRQKSPPETLLPHLLIHVHFLQPNTYSPSHGAQRMNVAQNTLFLHVFSSCRMYNGFCFTLDTYISFSGNPFPSIPVFLLAGHRYQLLLQLHRNNQFINKSKNKKTLHNKTTRYPSPEP